MNEAFSAIDNAIQEVKKLRVNLKRKKDPQVRSYKERNLIKATSLSWFNNHRKTVAALLSQETLNSFDQLYQKVLQSCDRAVKRKIYDDHLKDILGELIKLKGEVIRASTNTPIVTAETPPDFLSLTADVQMQTILKDRWKECLRCIAGKAPLAATVMMGGLLETLLLSRINKESDQSKIFKAKVAPKDGRTGRSLQLKEWTLRAYIDVAHELKWISQSAKDVGEVLRDYRNYIHPYKQFSHGTEFTIEDTYLFWEITKSISRQLMNPITKNEASKVP